MLTASQVETVGYVGDGAVFHRECAIREYSTVRIERADAGLDSGLTPLIRYSLDEWAGEDAYSLAEDKLDTWAWEHPELAYLFGVVPARGTWERNDATGYGRWVLPDGSQNYERLRDRLADRYADIAGPTCDRCYRPLTEDAPEQ